MIAAVRKALLAGLLAAVTAFVAALQAGQDPSLALVLSALGAGVIVGAATWKIPNETEEPTP